MKNIILTISFFAIIFFFSISYIFKPDILISTNERRKLMTKEELNAYSFNDTNFSDKFETYALDQINYRDTFRTIKTKVVFDIFKMKDNNDLYYEDGHWFKKDNAYNKRNVELFTDKINNIYNQYKTSNKYNIVIPDKSLYEKNRDVFKYDYNKLKMYLKDNLKGNFINIEDKINLDSYYYTDPHLKQESYLRLMPIISNKVGLTSNNKDYIKNTYEPFYGSYSGQALYNNKHDILNYYTNDTINNTKVKHLENNKSDKVYDIKGLSQIDSYDVFLSGASAYIHLSNGNNNTGRTLLVLRDSFGSSLAPLLLEDYSEIYIVDLRYISFKQASTMIPSNIDDIMSIYGAISINQSSNMR